MSALFDEAREREKYILANRYSRAGTASVASIDDSSIGPSPMLVNNIFIEGVLPAQLPESTGTSGIIIDSGNEAFNILQSHALLVLGHHRRTLFGFGVSENQPNTLNNEFSIRDTFGKAKSPFAILKALRADDSLFLDEIADVRNERLLRYQDQLTSRLEELLYLYKEDNEGRSLSVYSLRGLKQFLFANSDLRCPSLTVTPTGEMYAQWKNKHKSCVLSIHFISDIDARFFILNPNKKHANKLVTLSGSTTVDTLMEIIEPHGVMEWAKHEG